MVDHIKWRFYQRNERASDSAFYKHLFPRVCEKIKEDPVRLIEKAPPPKERTSAQNNMILLPRIKEVERSNSLFVERRRYAR